MITSPGSSVMTCVMNSISSFGPNVSSDVRAAWRVSPPTRHSTATSVGSNTVSIHGPSGQKPSNPLPRVHWPSFACRSRAVTSLPHVKPRMYFPASSDFTYRARRPMTTASSASWSTRSEMLGYGMGSPGPMTEVEGFRKISGSSGTSPPISSAWST